MEGDREKVSKRGESVAGVRERERREGNRTTISGSRG